MRQFSTQFVDALERNVIFAQTVQWQSTQSCMDKAIAGTQARRLEFNGMFSRQGRTPGAGSLCRRLPLLLLLFHHILVRQRLQPLIHGLLCKASDNFDAQAYKRLKKEAQSTYQMMRKCPAGCQNQAGSQSDGELTSTQAPCRSYTTCPSSVCRSPTHRQRATKVCPPNKTICCNST